MPDIVVSADVHAFMQAADKAAARAALDSGMVLNLFQVSFNPVDAIVYYFGGNLNLTEGAIRVEANAVVDVPRAGTIRRVFVKIRSGVAGSAESVQFDLRLNASTTVALSSTTLDAVVRDVVTSGLSQAVAQGDQLCIRATCPTWGVNPTAVSFYIAVYID